MLWEFSFISLAALMAIFQGSVYGIAGRFPEKYINGVTSGQALGGVFSSLARIASVLFALNDLTSALIYFLVAVAVMMLTLVAFVCVSRTVRTRVQGCRPHVGVWGMRMIPYEYVNLIRGNSLNLNLQVN